MDRFLLRLGVIVVILLVVVPAVAQSKSVEVPRRDAEITILPNGDVQIVETWEVKYNGGPFTSAYRSIPLNRVDSIDGWSVADADRQYRQVDKGSSKEPYTFEYTIGDGQMKATWFYPATTNQTRTFKVGYTLRGALRIDPVGDEFYWKFVESDRQYPISASRVVLHLPVRFEAGQLKTTTYRNGAEQTGARVADDRTIEFTGGPFPSGTEWEIRAQLPHGVVKASPPGWQVAAPQTSPAPQWVNQAYLERFQRETTIGNLALGATVVAGIGAVIWLRRLDRRKAVKPARLATILLIPGAAYTAVNLLFGSLIWGSVCMMTFLAGFLTMLAATISAPGSGGGSTSWGGGDWGGGGDFGGGGSDGGGGGSSGFD